MALILIDNPPTTPTLTSQWTDFVNRSNANMIGAGLDLAIFTLSNWDGGTAKPQVEKGSIIEVGGSFYQADSATALTDDSGITDGTVHIKMVVSGSAVIPTITNDSLPSWDSEQGGWYSSGEKFLPHEMTRGSSGTTFVNKFEYKFLQSAIVKLYANGAVYFPGAGEFGGTGTFGGGLSVGGNTAISGAITSVTNITASGTVSAPTGNITTVNSTTGNITTVNSSAVNSGTGTFTGAISATTLSTGQGNNELYGMNQNVRTTSSPTFASVKSGRDFIKWETFTGTLDGSGSATITILFTTIYGVSTIGYVGLSPNRQEVPWEINSGTQLVLSGAANTAYTAIIFYE